MIDEIRPDLFRIELPLPRNPLRAANSYVIRGSDRNLIVDTGMNRQECRDALDAGLTDLDLNLERTDVLITHMHADHCGQVSRLLSKGARAYVGRLDAGVMRDGPHWDAMADSAALNGFPASKLAPAIERHPAKMYGGYGQVEYTLLGEGDKLAVGDYLFRCIETPGHTAGHICLYEEDRKILISGDHVLGDITPNISSWTSDEDRLGQYLESLDRVARLDVRLVLPGHRRIFEDCKGRIAELKTHHQARADEVLAILDGDPMTAFDVAARMTWDIRADSFEQFPVAQQWFATGEAVAPSVSQAGLSIGIHGDVDRLSR